MKWMGYSTGIKVDVVIETMKEGYMAYVPNLPGCVSTGESPEEAVENLREIIEDYLDLDFEINMDISSESDVTRNIAG